MLKGTTIACLFFIATITAHAQDLKWMPFRWKGDSISGKYFDKSAMFVPLKIDDIPANFSMQFDLGAVNTVIYGNAIEPYLDAYPYLKNKIDTSKKFFMQGETHPMFANMQLKMGTAIFKNTDVGYFENFGSSIDKDSILSKTEKHIGTIGPDLFQGKILIIDYPQKRIGVCQEMPAQYKKATFLPFRTDHGRPIIPLTISDSTRDVLFDTGSSLFTLMALKEDVLKTGTKVVDSLAVMSWGNELMYYGIQTNTAIKYGNKVLNGDVIYYDEKDTFGGLYQYLKIWGLTGNVFFLKSTVIIDYKNNVFGVL